MSEALRDNAGKPELAQLLHFLPALEELAAHCTAGRAKYPDTDGAPNWTLGGKPDEEYLDAAMRHLALVVSGEEYDTELGTTHAAAVIWNMCAYITCNYPMRAKTKPAVLRITPETDRDYPWHSFVKDPYAPTYEERLEKTPGVTIIDDPFVSADDLAAHVREHRSFYERHWHRHG